MVKKTPKTTGNREIINFFQELSLNQIKIVSGRPLQTL